MSPDGCPSALGQPSPRTVCPGWGNPKPKGLRRRDTIDSPLAVLICASFSVYSPSGSKREGDDASGPPMSPCSGQPPTDARLRPAPPCPTHCTLASLPSSSPLQIPVAAQEGRERGWSQLLRTRRYKGTRNMDVQDSLKRIAGVSQEPMALLNHLPQILNTDRCPLSHPHDSHCLIKMEASIWELVWEPSLPFLHGNQVALL